MTSIYWRGTTELATRLAKAAVEAPIGLGVALYLEGQAIIADSIPITPIEFGALRSSAFVDRPEITPAGASVTIGFGGAAADYALFVHEDPNAHHEPPTQYKFLEQPALEHQRDFDKRIAAGLELAL